MKYLFKRKRNNDVNSSGNTAITLDHADADFSIKLWPTVFQNNFACEEIFMKVINCPV